MKGFNETVTFTLCNTLCNNGHITSDAIKAQVKLIWPHSKNMSPQNLFNIRIHVKRLLPITKVTQEFEKLQEIHNTSNVVKGLDETIITEDETIKIENETW